MPTERQIGQVTEQVEAVLAQEPETHTALRNQRADSTLVEMLFRSTHGDRGLERSLARWQVDVVSFTGPRRYGIEFQIWRRIRRRKRLVCGVTVIVEKRTKRVSLSIDLPHEEN